MKVLDDGVVISTDPACILASIEERIGQLYMQGGSANAVARRDLEQQRDAWRRLVDDEVTARWEGLHARYWRHRRDMEKHGGTCAR